MSKRKSQQGSKWILGLGGLGLILVLALWIWPTYINSPAALDSGPVSVQTAQGHIGVAEANQMKVDGAFLLDVRTQEEWDAGHIPGATLIPLDQLPYRYGELPTDQDIVIYCRSGNRSGQALDYLTDKGITGIYSMDGGINDWISAGYEVVLP